MNKKDRQKTLIIVTVIILAVGLLFLTGIIKLPFFVAGSSCSGGTTVLSISNALITTSQDLNGKEVVRVTAVANGGGECLTINWKNTDLQNELGDDYIVDNGVYGNLITISQSQKFTTNPQQSQFIYKAKKGEVSTLWCDINACQQSYTDVLYAYRVFLGYPCTCIYKQLIGQNGKFSSSYSRDFDVLFSIDGLGETHITNSKQSALIGSKAFIKWSGDLMTGNWLTVPNYDSYLSNSDGKWRMSDSDFYNTISNRLETDSRSSGCLSPTSSTGSGGIDSCISKYNAFVDLQTTNKDSNFINENDLISTSGWKDYQFKADLNTFTSWQVFTIDLDATSVGIHKNIGIPEVQCPSGRPEITSGKSISAIYKVRDKAGTNPSFGLILDCDDGTGILSKDRISNVGTSFVSISSTISSTTTTTDKDFSCKFEAYDLNNPDSSDSCTADYKVIPFTGCTAGEKSCSSDGGKLGTCNSAGTGFDFIDCQYGCEGFENTYRCRLQSDPDPDDEFCADCDAFVLNTLFGSTWTEKSCKPVGALDAILNIRWPQSNTICWLSWVKFALMALALLLGTLSGVELFGKFKSINKYPIVVWLLSVGSAVLLSYLVYILFWLGVIIMIAYFIISMGFKSIPIVGQIQGVRKYLR